MLTTRALLLAAWVAAMTVVPALATVNPIVRPAIDRIPDRPLFTPRPTPPPNNPSPIKADVTLATRYDDGQVCYGAQCHTPTVYYQPVRQGYGPFRGGGWWRAGPARRFISAPFRWLFRR